MHWQCPLSHQLTVLQDGHHHFLPSSFRYSQNQLHYVAWTSCLDCKDWSTAEGCHFQCDFPLVKLALPPVLIALMKPAAGLELHCREAQLAGPRDSLLSIASTHQQPHEPGSRIFLVSLKVTKAPFVGWMLA